MTSRISHTSIDCRNAYDLARWWQQVLDYRDDPDDPNEPGHDECLIISGDGSHRILFLEVPESKSVKNRIHFDLRPTDRTQSEEIDRVLALGATAGEDFRGKYGPGTGWQILADPEGNEFCILRSESEAAATGD